MRIKGFTLIEVIVVLAIIGILAAILVPMIGAYLEDANRRRAEQDVQTLGKAVLAFNKDVVRFPIYKDGGSTGTGAGVFTVIVGDGDAPGASVDGVSWNPASTEVDTLVNQLVKNSPAGDSLKKYPTTGEFAWRGPYVSEAKKDPWGSRYVVNALNLVPGGTNAAWVLSAGPNKTIETGFSQPRSTAAIGGDDIGFRIK